MQKLKCFSSFYSAFVFKLFSEWNAKVKLVSITFSDNFVMSAHKSHLKSALHQSIYNLAREIFFNYRWCNKQASKQQFQMALVNGAFISYFNQMQTKWTECSIPTLKRNFAFHSNRFVWIELNMHYKSQQVLWVQQHGNWMDFFFIFCF